MLWHVVCCIVLVGVAQVWSVMSRSGLARFVPFSSGLCCYALSGSCQRSGLVG
jgi:hypothetical protein